LTSAAPPPTDPDDVAPEARLNALLADGRLTIAAAESCTGGNVARRITDIPGSSAYFLGSIVSYSNGAKHKLLGVPEDVLKNPGAVSEPTARAMAEGARRAFAADVAVATTGIAGPAGGTTRKPVGTVFIAAGGPAGTIVEEHHFPGGRADVTAAATEAALRLLADAVETALEESGVSGQGSGAGREPPAVPDA
jgi:PncC family amidohydrolase